MMHLYVLAVLKHIFGIALQTIYINVLAEHKRISAAMQGDILQAQVFHLPEGLVGIGDIDIFQYDVLHLTEKFRAINAATAHLKVVGVPDG